MAGVLSAICEVDLLEFSHRYRPGRNPHQGMAALYTSLTTQCVKPVLDAGIRRFLESVDQVSQL